MIFKSERLWDRLSVEAVWRLPGSGPAVALFVGHAMDGSLRLVPAIAETGGTVSENGAPGQEAGGVGWRRAVGGDGAAERLVGALVAGAEPPPAFRVRTFEGLAPAGGERPIMVDQTNESVVVGDCVVVKWMSRPERRAHPAPVLLGHLAEVGFARTPAPRATVSWLAPDGTEVLLALVCAYLPEAADGWDWCVGDLLAHLAGRGRADFAADLGELAADLHAALATPSTVFTSPVTYAEDAHEWSRRAGAMLDNALALTGGADGEWLAGRAARLRDDLAVRVDRTPVLRIHGDLHVGQVLRWRKGYAVIDFDGNPAVPGEIRPEPAARDVAQLMTSIEHVGQITDRRTERRYAGAIARWAAASRAAFLAAYRDRLAVHGVADLLDERLLRAFEVEQECRELVYAARFLPRWTYAPMGVLRSWYP